MESINSISKMKTEHINSDKEPAETKDHNHVAHLSTINALQQAAGSNESKQNTTSPQQPTSNQSPDAFIIRTKKFFISQDAPQWTMVILTSFIVVLTFATTYFNCRYISIYEATTHIDTRAYMVIKSVYMGDSPPIRITVEFTNAGKTPAYKMKHTGATKLGSTGISSADIDSIEHSILGDNPYNTVGAGVPYLGKLAPQDTSAISFYQVLSGMRPLFILGKLKYIDRFGEAHFTNYCFRYSFTTKHFASYGQYNDAN